MDNAVFRKTIENVRELRRNDLISEPKYHITIFFFSEKLLAIKMRKIQILMNKPVYLGLSILELSKIVIYGFWYEYVKPKYSERAKWCYMDTDSFILHAKNLWYLKRHWRKYWDKVWYFKLWVEQSFTKRKK